MLSPPAIPATPPPRSSRPWPGRPRRHRLYVEWSINEKVALEAAAAASFSGLRALATMKQNGVNVASDFITNLTLSGTGAGLLLITCDDPSGISSTNEQDARFIARLADLPLLEPSSPQEALEMTRWAFDLSEGHAESGGPAQRIPAFPFPAKLPGKRPPAIRNPGPISTLTASFTPSR